MAISLYLSWKCQQNVDDILQTFRFVADFLKKCVNLRHVTKFHVWVFCQQHAVCNDMWPKDVAFNFWKDFIAISAKQSAGVSIKQIPTEKYPDALLEAEFDFNINSIVKKINVTALWHQRFAMQMHCKCIAMHHFSLSPLFSS